MRFSCFVIVLLLSLVSGTAIATSGGEGTPDHIAASPPGHERWAFDLHAAGASKPPRGRSLFDFLFTVARGDTRHYQIPFPLSALTEKISQQLDSGRLGPSLQQVLIPLGRSLQRNVANPLSFEFPRVVVAAVAGPRYEPGRSGLMLKDRLYIGYNEKAGLLEVISYNEAAGRFEFQLVKDYFPGTEPKVFYASREVCVSCHQNGSPIFSRPLWSETNSNPRVAERLRAARDDFYNIPVAVGVDVPNTIDDATDRANLFSVQQILWQRICGDDDPEARRCRIGLLKFMLQHRLNGKRGFDRTAPDYVRVLLPHIEANAGALWPEGLLVPSADIPNRDPLPGSGTSLRSGLADNTAVDQLIALHHVPSALDPLKPRAALKSWAVANPDDVMSSIIGLADFIAETDIRRIDRHIYDAAYRSSRTRAYTTPCDITEKGLSRSRIRLSFGCSGAGLGAAGRVVLEDGTIQTGSIRRISIGHHTITNAQITDGKLETATGESKLFLQLSYNGLHLRTNNGNAVSGFGLSWPSELKPGSKTKAKHEGRMSLTMLDDFALIDAALVDIDHSDDDYARDAFSSKPFRRVAVLKTLFGRLGIEPVSWCCLDTSGMPPVRTAAVSAVDGADEPGRQELILFRTYCAKCHQTAESTPPNWLYGSSTQVAGNMAQCAERLFFRLSMWQLPAGNRPKSPMPPVQSLHGFNASVEDWGRGEVLESLRRYSAGLVEQQTGSAPDLDALMSRGYEHLRQCLAAG